MGLYTIENGYQNKRRFRYGGLLSLVLVSVTAITSYVYLRPDPSSLATDLSSQVQALPEHQQKLISPLPWPEYGQAAYGVVNEGVLAESNDSEQAVPVASLAKVITALAILKEKPLKPGEQGPSILLSEKDEELFQKYLAINGTVVPVKAGETISQYQAMQAMLMMSANNMADTLVLWVFGSIDNYNNYANKMLDEYGFKKTTVADSTGFSPSTKSTASEMVKLGILYLSDPVLREIAMQEEANIPFAGVISNYNSTINKGGIIGLKVGYTDEAGRSFLVADIRDSNIAEASVVAVIGADSLPLAMKDATTILKSGNRGHDMLYKKS